MSGPRYKIRVILPNGTVLTDDLPHVEKSTYEKWAYQSGLNVPTASIGRWAVYGLPPESDDYKEAAYLYKQIVMYSRIEISYGVGQKAPRYAGVVDRISSEPSNFSIEGFDSSQMGQYKQRLWGFTSNDPADVGMRRWGLNYYTLANLYDFSDLASWVRTNNGTWSQGVVEGIPGLLFRFSGGSPNGGSIQAPSALPGLSDAVINFDLILQFPTQPVAQYQSSSQLNFYFGPALGGIQFNFRVDAGTVNGAGTNQNLAGIAFMGITSYVSQMNPVTDNTSAPIIPVGVMDANGTTTARVQVSVMSYTNSSGSVNWQVYLNNQATGAVALNVPKSQLAAFAPTLNFSCSAPLTAGLPGFQAHISNFWVLTQSAIFTEGVIGTPVITAAPPPHNFAKPTVLDCQHVFASQEGWSLRFTPQASPALDILDANLNPGSATGIRFVEGGNMKNLKLEPNFAAAASLEAVIGSGGSGNGLAYLAFDKAGYDKYGLIVRQVNWEDGSNIAVLRTVGRNSVAEAAEGPVAKTWVVNDELTDGLWRELDTVVLHDPEQGVVEQVVQVVGYKCTEGTWEKEVFGDQYPLTHIKGHVHKLRAQIDNALSGATRVSLGTPNGLASLDLGLRQSVLFAHSNGIPALVGGQFNDGRYGVRIYDSFGTLVTYKDGAGVTQSMDFTS